MTRSRAMAGYVSSETLRQAYTAQDAALGVARLLFNLAFATQPVGTGGWVASIRSSFLELRGMNHNSQFCTGVVFPPVSVLVLLMG